MRPAASARADEGKVVVLGESEDSEDSEEKELADIVWAGGLVVRGSERAINKLALGDK
jgi:hypothetical protein